MKNIFFYFLIFVLSFSLFSCNGWRSSKPPVHLNPNMDFQPKNIAQSDSLERPDNTVPWGDDQSLSDLSEREKFIQSDSIFYSGKTNSGQWVKSIPIDVTFKLLDRGQDRYNIYCTPCHGIDGSGNGAVSKRGWMIPAPYWDDRILAYTDGELYDIITNGIRTMPSYKQQISPSDRWAIVGYIKALQKSNLSSLKDVPSELKNQIME